MAMDGNHVKLWDTCQSHFTVYMCEIAWPTHTCTVDLTMLLSWSGSWTVCGWINFIRVQAHFALVRPRSINETDICMAICQVCLDYGLLHFFLLFFLTRIQNSSLQSRQDRRPREDRAKGHRSHSNPGCCFLAIRHMGTRLTSDLNCFLFAVCLFCICSKDEFVPLVCDRRTLVEIRSSHITWIKHYLGDQISFKYSRTRKKWEGVLMRIKVYLKFACRSGPCLLSVGFLLTHWLLGLLWTHPVLLVHPELPHWLMKTPLPLQKQA